LTAINNFEKHRNGLVLAKQVNSSLSWVLLCVDTIW